MEVVNTVMSEEEKAIIKADYIKNRQIKIDNNRKWKDANPEKYKAMNKAYQQKARDAMKQKLIDAGVIQKKVVMPKLSYTLKDEKKPFVPYLTMPIYLKTGVKAVSKASTIKYMGYFKKVDAMFNTDAFNADIVSQVYQGKFSDENDVYIINRLSYFNDENIDANLILLKEKVLNINSLRSYLGAYIVLASYYAVFKNAYTKLSNLSNQCKVIYDEKRGENAITVAEATKIIDFNYKAIVKVYNSIDNITDALLFGLYCLEVPRRLEYHKVILTDITDITLLDDNNYLFVKDGQYTFVFNDYKTFKKYGKQTLNVCKNVNDIITKYVLAKELSAGDYLFHSRIYKKDCYMLSHSFCQKIKIVFKRLYDIDNITNTFIRMSYSSFINTIKMSDNALKKLCILMGHSLLEHHSYVKKFVV